MNYSEVRDWATLDDDVVGVILSKMVSVYDYLHFSVVCKSWFFTSLHFKCQPSIITSKFHQIPMLIVPNSILQDQHQSLYDFRTNDIRPIHFKIPFDKRCCGSSFGWLIMLENSLHVSLFNPFSGAHILLPPINMEPLQPNVYTSTGLAKAILTKDPSLYPNDYMIVALYSLYHKICLLKASDQTWIYQNPQEQYYHTDVNHCNDTLYAIDQNMILRKIEVLDENSSISLVAIIPELNLYQNDRKLFPFEKSCSDIVYVVESSKREVLLIRRFFSIIWSGSVSDLDSNVLCLKTIKITVYKLSDECDDNGIHQVTEVESLDGDTMFIGDNQSICVRSNDFFNCPSNHIYYTDNCDYYGIPLIYGPQDAGIYSLEDKSFNKHYLTDPADKNLPPPIWIVPTICFKDLKD